jgi:hypothetical protein
MKKIICLILTVLFSLFSSPVFPSEIAVQPANISILSKIDKNYSSKEWHSLPEQSFLVKFGKDDSTEKLFVSMVAEDSSDWRFLIYDSKGESLLSTLSKSESAIERIFSFTKIDAIAFKDLNGDGILDVLVILDYFDSRPVQDEGIGGGNSKLSLAYISQDEQFALNEDCVDENSIRKLAACQVKRLRSTH